MALALSKIAALEREVDDLHDVELTMMQREQLRVRRDARLNAATNIQNKELTIQLNEALDQIEIERQKNIDLSQANDRLKIKVETMESELKSAHKAIIEETTAANVAKTQVSQLTRRLRISEAELIASHSRVAEKEAIADHFKESLKVTNQALDQELLASERLHKVWSPSSSAFVDEYKNDNSTTVANKYLSSRNRMLEEMLEQEHRLNIAKDIERTRELGKIRRYVNSPTRLSSPTGGTLNFELLKSNSLTLDDASLIRAKAKAMAAAAEERLKIEEELYQMRLRSST